jgi:predicted transcriptional regulator
MQSLDGKRGIIAALEQALNDDATVEEAIDYLLYLQGIEEGLADEEAGRMVPHEEIVEMIKSWAK